MAVSSETAIVNCPPHDMIYEIFNRCEINTLDVLKAVCKDFKNLVYDPSFIDGYYEKEDNVNGYLLQAHLRVKFKQSFISINESDKSFTFPPRELKIKFDDIQIVGSSLQGILCCVVKYNRMFRFYVCKPMTEQWQPLPNPKTRHFAAFFEYIGFAVLRSKPLRFTIIRISKSKKGFCRKLLGYRCYRCEIFDSKRWSWKEMDDLLLPSETFLVNRPAVHAGGHISWLTFKGDVLSFETNGENHRILAMPEAAREAHFRRIIEYEGKLGYVFNRDDNEQFELWVLGNWESGFWRRIHAFGVQCPGTTAPPSTAEAFYSSDVAVLSKPFWTMFYRIKSSSFKEVDVGGGLAVGFDQIFPFRSDYEPVDFKHKF